METKQRFQEQNFPLDVWRNKARDFLNVILEDYYSLQAKSEAGLVFRLNFWTYYWAQPKWQVLSMNACALNTQKALST